MRSGIAVAAYLAPLAVAGAIVAATACGGTAFTTAPGADGGPTGAGGGVTPEAGSSEAGTSFCGVEAGTHTFCDDFDGPPLSSKWSSIDQANDGTAATDPTRSYSPPNSLKTYAPAVLGISRGRVIQTFGTASKVTVAFEVWIDTVPPKLASATTTSGNNFVEIDIGSSYSIGMSAHSDEVAYFEALGGDASAPPLNDKQLIATSTMEGVWTEVVIVVDIGNATLSITIGGQPQLSGAPITPPTGQTVSVALGAYLRNEGLPGLTTNYDNVTIDIAQ